MCGALNEQRGVIVQRLLGALRGNFLELHQPTQDLSDFQIEQAWRVQTLFGIQSTGFDLLTEFRL